MWGSYITYCDTHTSSSGLPSFSMSDTGLSLATSSSEDGHACVCI